MKRFKFFLMVGSAVGVLLVPKLSYAQQQGSAEIIPLEAAHEHEDGEDHDHEHEETPSDMEEVESRVTAPEDTGSTLTIAPDDRAPQASSIRRQRYNAPEATPEPSRLFGNPRR